MKLLTLDDATDPTRCGHKAATLSALRRTGHNIPDGFVILAGSALDPTLFAEALARLGEGPFAVRSSGVAEDLPSASHAGRYTTVLGVDTLDDVMAASQRVVASANGDEPMGVLVQRLVAADAAGVAFTANPVTGDDEVVIEATAGLGDRLLAGEIDGERWIVRDRACCQTDARVLDVDMTGRIADLSRRIAAERGAPQDVEWALAKGELYVLQARPITRLPVKPEFAFPPGRWTKDTSHFNGPMTVVGASILLPAYEAAFRQVFADFGMPLDTIRQRAFGGEVYTQDVDLRGEHDPSAPPPWWVLAIAVRLLPSMRKRLRAAESASLKLDNYPRQWETSWRAACADRIEQARAVDLSALDAKGLLTELDRIVDEVLRPHLVIHFQLTVPHMVGTYELVKCCEVFLGWDLKRAMRLLTGTSAATTAATREMKGITGPGPELDAWVARWGLRTIDAEPGSPMLSEREDLILGLVQSSCEVRASDREEAIAEARARLDGAELERFERALAYAQVVYPMRDDNVLYTEGLPCGLVRRVLLEIGKRLALAGTIDAADDVAFFEAGELRAALSAGTSLAERIHRRKSERAWVLAHPGPSMVGPAPVPDPDPRGLPQPLRRLMEATGWALHHEMVTPTSQRDGAGNLVGIPVSPGTYTGPARIVRGEDELDRLQPGDVLVCPTTHSSWAVIFGHAGALVTDAGGMLSHPAIIAREHGVPAVLGTGNATSTLVDGQLVTVDGNAGVVRRMESAPRSSGRPNSILRG